MGVTLFGGGGGGDQPFNGSLITERSCDVLVEILAHSAIMPSFAVIGPQKQLNEWFRSYLAKRKQCVIINGIQSDISDLCKYGVPQGSVLGPILFLLFINDINKSLDHINVKLFADDTNCFISGNNFNQLERLVEVELNKLQKMDKRK